MSVIPLAGNSLDRASQKRSDSAWIGARRRDASSLIWPMWRLQPFLLGDESARSVEAGYLRPGLSESCAAADAPFIFLGIDESGAAVFALDISAAADPASRGPLAGLGHFRDARTAAQLLPLKDAAIL